MMVNYNLSRSILLTYICTWCMFTWNCLNNALQFYSRCVVSTMYVHVPCKYYYKLPWTVNSANLRGAGNIRSNKYKYHLDKIL